MPLYEYRCPNGHDFEKFYRSIGVAGAEAECPVCGAIGARVMSTAGLVFKGSGFYITDYGKDGKKAEREAITAEKKKADTAAEKTAEPKPSESAAGSTESAATQSSKSSESAAPGGSQSAAKPAAKQASEPAVKPAAKNKTSE
jgi:putative FmdB family regulatory protein